MRRVSDIGVAFAFFPVYTVFYGCDLLVFFCSVGVPAMYQAVVGFMMGLAFWEGLTTRAVWLRGDERSRLGCAGAQDRVQRLSSGSTRTVVRCLGFLTTWPVGSGWKPLLVAYLGSVGVLNGNTARMACSLAFSGSGLPVRNRDRSLHQRVQASILFSWVNWLATAVVSSCRMLSVSRPVMKCRCI